MPTKVQRRMPKHFKQRDGALEMGVWFLALLPAAWGFGRAPLRPPGDGTSLLPFFIAYF